MLAVCLMDVLDDTIRPSQHSDGLMAEACSTVLRSRLGRTGDSKGVVQCHHHPQHHQQAERSNHVMMRP